MPRVARGTVLLALVGVVTASAGAIQAAGVQDGQPGGAGPQPSFESRLGVWLGGVAVSSAETRVIVREVVRGSGADRAGVREGDLLIECEAEPVGSTEEVAGLLEQAPFGSVVRIGVMRGGKRIDVKVMLDASRREHFLAPFSRGATREGPYLRMLPLGGTERLGIEAIELTPQLAEYFGTDGGVLVARVRHWSPADRARLKAGDVVTRIDGHRVRTQHDLAAALHRTLAGARLTIAVTRDGRNRPIQVQVRR